MHMDQRKTHQDALRNTEAELLFFFFGDRTSLVVQWLRLYISTANCTASIPGWDLKSHMPCSMPENFKERKGIQKQR